VSDCAESAEPARFYGQCDETSAGQFQPVGPLAGFLQASRLGDSAVAGEDDDGRLRPVSFCRHKQVNGQAQVFFHVQPDQLTPEAVNLDAFLDFGFQL